MTLEHLILALADEASVSRAEARAVLDGLATLLSLDVLLAGDSIAVPGLGTFYPRRRCARPIRNPATGERMDLPALVDVGFRPSKKLKRKDVLS